jgi:hypothetical protein
MGFKPLIHADFREGLKYIGYEAHVASLFKHMLMLFNIAFQRS